MNKKIVFGLSISIILLMTFAGCVDNQTTSLPLHLQKIKDAGKLIVGTNAEYPPWEFVNETNGEFEGFDIDVARAIANHLSSELGKTIELEVMNMTFDEDLFAHVLNNSEVDLVIAALTINTERGEKMLFSNPYFSEGQVIIINDSTTDINDPEDLVNKTVGVQNGTTSEDAARQYTDKIIEYDTYEPALRALLAGELDAIVIDSRAGADLIKGISGVETIGEPFTVEYYGIAMKKGETALKDEIDKVISDLKSSGDLQKIEDKWL